MTLIILRRAICAFLFIAFVVTPIIAIAADGAPNDAKLLENIVLLKGRLETARELIRIGKSDIALKRHLGENLNSRVAKIEPEFEARKLKTINQELKGLVDGVASLGRYEAALAKITTALATIEATIPVQKLASPKFLADVLSKVVAHAAEDYHAGVKDGKVDVIKEFEEVFGYDRAAVALWKMRLEPALAGRSPILADAFNKLSSAVPSPVPPANIDMTPATFDTLSASISAEATKLK